MKLFLEVLALVAGLSGIAIVRVGFFGRYLGRGRFVSHVAVHPEPPQWYHRAITVALGAIVIFVASAVFTMLFQSAR
ncbi:MAG TPA: hypothetical protein VMB47_00745 [Candidatus Aquilonibacter sp.]|nr:hypothetical protein [Candidatus Aquilonibacter sp.]